MITLPEYPTFKSSYEDITSMNKEQQETFFLQKDEKDHDHRFDLKEYPLFYCNIYKTGEVTPQAHWQGRHPRMPLAPLPQQSGFPLLRTNQTSRTAHTQFPDALMRPYP